MSDVLKTLEPDAAWEALIAATRSFLPSPREDAGEGATAQTLPKTALMVLDELRHTLGIRETDVSAGARTRILERLTKEMSDRALKGADMKAMKARAGAEGLLRPDYYSIVFAEQFNQISLKEGVSQADVRKAIHQPDSVYHHRRISEGTSAAPQFSFFAKAINDSANGKFSLLVSCQRDGDVQKVNLVWQVFADEINLRQSAFELWRDFTRVYGLAFRFLTSEESKLLIDYVGVSPFSAPTAPDLLKLFTFSTTPVPGFNVDMLVKLSTLQTVDVGFAYVIETKKYHASLKRHGIKVRS